MSWVQMLHFKEKMKEDVMRAFLRSCYLFSLLFALFLLGKKKDWG